MKYICMNKTLVTTFTIYNGPLNWFLHETFSAKKFVTVFKKFSI